MATMWYNKVILDYDMTAAESNSDDNYLQTEMVIDDGHISYMGMKLSPNPSDPLVMDLLTTDEERTRYIELVRVLGFSIGDDETTEIVNDHNRVLEAMIYARNVFDEFEEVFGNEDRKEILDEARGYLSQIENILAGINFDYSDDEKDVGSLCHEIQSTPAHLESSIKMAMELGDDAVILEPMVDSHLGILRRKYAGMLEDYFDDLQDIKSQILSKVKSEGGSLVNETNEAGYSKFQVMDIHFSDNLKGIRVVDQYARMRAGSFISTAFANVVRYTEKLEDLRNPKVYIDVSRTKDGSIKISIFNEGMFKDGDTRGPYLNNQYEMAYSGRGNVETVADPNHEDSNADALLSLNQSGIRTRVYGSEDWFCADIEIPSSFVFGVSKISEEA
jgi:hypothetical protein